VDRDGRTPLHLTQDANTAGNLVKAGADVDIQDAQGRLPTDGALYNKVSAIETEHSKREASVGQPAHRGFDAIYSALDAPAEAIRPTPPRTRQRP
nr:ankyrin repeat domain-containing protein [Allgaiera sp.]